MKNPFNATRSISSTGLILLTAFFLMASANVAFFTNVLAVYPLSLKNAGFLVSLVVVFTGITVLMLSLASYRYTIKPVVITVLLVSSVAAYFMDSYTRSGIHGH